VENNSSQQEQTNRKGSTRREEKEKMKEGFEFPIAQVSGLERHVDCLRFAQNAATGQKACSSLMMCLVRLLWDRVWMMQCFSVVSRIA